jgi:hypothetical protein
MTWLFPSSTADRVRSRTPEGYETHPGPPVTAQTIGVALLASDRHGRLGRMDEGKTAEKTGSFS